MVSFDMHIVKQEPIDCLGGQLNDDGGRWN